MNSNRKILFPGETITIIEHRHSQYLEMIFYGYTKKTEFQNAWLKLVENLYQGVNAKLLLDQKYMHVQPDSFEWFKNELIPSANKLNTKLNVAIVAAVNFLGEYQVKQDATYLMSICKNISIHFFDDFDNAQKWMLS